MLHHLVRAAQQLDLGVELFSILQLTMGCEASSFFYADTKEYKTCLAPEIGLSIKTKKFKGSINANAIIKEAEKKASWKLSSIVQF